MRESARFERRRRLKHAESRRLQEIPRKVVDEPLKFWETSADLVWSAALTESVVPQQARLPELPDACFVRSCEKNSQPLDEN